jgi:hypothetical protein
MTPEIDPEEAMKRLKQHFDSCEGSPPSQLPRPSLLLGGFGRGQVKTASGSSVGGRRWDHIDEHML